MSSIKARFPQIKAVVLDVDGVLTDGSIVVTTNGEEHRIMNTKDGYALHHASKVGFPVWVISGGKSEGVAVRLKRLGLTEVHLGVENKLSILHKLMNQYDIKKEELLYMGDDLPDYDAMQMAGIAVCPQDAVPEIKAIAHYIVPIDGGRGCVRHLLRELLQMQGKWFVSNAFSA
jgi:3-deoxy-D-manno-octulosonate 8-phosphate phosphatase (KDO 8-P phosphatase)